jgi:hypothetical protein
VCVDEVSERRVTALLLPGGMRGWRARKTRPLRSDGTQKRGGLSLRKKSSDAKGRQRLQRPRRKTNPDALAVCCPRRPEAPLGLSSRPRTSSGRLPSGLPDCPSPPVSPRLPGACRTNHGRGTHSPERHRRLRSGTPRASRADGRAPYPLGVDVAGARASIAHHETLLSQRCHSPLRMACVLSWVMLA